MRKRGPDLEALPHRYATPARKELKLKHWRPLKMIIAEFVGKAGYGAASALAKHLGCHPSQIHRYLCPDCEHDAEPTYSTAMEIIAFITKWSNEGEKPIPRPIRGNHSGKPRHHKGKPHAWVVRTLTRRTQRVILPKTIRVK